MILNVENVSVRYLSGDFREIGLKDYIVKKISGKYTIEENWAVKNVSFSLEKGDFLGIIGTNGAGKSTILKAISGVMKPYSGKITVDGSVSALLELGTGFDGDLTLRENIYLRGALLGYSREMIDERCQEILKFAELEEYESRTYKQLSSGMKSRLAFSISCLVNPDILILDEVLSVGDGSFRAKSENKMFEIIKGGATTIFVSHSLAQIKRLCNKVLWLHKGEQIAFGEAKPICAQYESFLSSGTLPSGEDVEQQDLTNVVINSAVQRTAEPEMNIDYLNINMYFKLFRGLCNYEDYIFFVACKEDMMVLLNKFVEREKIGLCRHIGFAESYIAVLDPANEQYYEDVGCSIITYEYKNENVFDQQVTIVSGGTKCMENGQTVVASIKIDGVEHCMNSRGCNVVVYQKSTKKVVDSFVCDLNRDNSLRVRSRFGLNYVQRVLAEL